MKQTVRDFRDLKQFSTESIFRELLNRIGRRGVEDSLKEYMNIYHKDSRRLIDIHSYSEEEILMCRNIVKELEQINK